MHALSDRLPRLFWKDFELPCLQPQRSLTSQNPCIPAAKRAQPWYEVHAMRSMSLSSGGERAGDHVNSNQFSAQPWHWAWMKHSSTVGTAVPSPVSYGGSSLENGVLHGLCTLRTRLSFEDALKNDQQKLLFSVPIPCMTLCPHPASPQLHKV